MRTVTKTERPFRLERPRPTYAGQLVWRCYATFTTLDRALAGMGNLWHADWRIDDARTGAVVHPAPKEDER